MTDSQRPHCQNQDACAAKTPTTHCRRCRALAIWADPALREKTIAAIKDRYDAPGGRERHAAHMSRISKANWATPEIRARMTEASAARAHLTVASPECQALAQAPEVKERRIASHLRTKYAWCPPERYAEYRNLVDVKSIKPSEARRMIEEDMAAEVRRQIASVSNDMLAKERRRKAQAY